MLHISFSNLLLLTVSRSSMYLIVLLNFLATQVLFHQTFHIRVLVMKKEPVCQLECTICSHRNANNLSIHLATNFNIPYSSKFSWHNIFVINPSFTKFFSTKINQCKATKIIGCHVHVVGGASRKCSLNFAAIAKFLPRKLKLLLI